MQQIDCHEEQIHLCGQIQDFGYLFIFDSLGRCIANSENIVEILDTDGTSLWGTHIDRLLGELTNDDSLNLDTVSQQLATSIFYRFAERITINEADYHLSIYRFNDKLYVELEVCNIHQIKPTRLYYYAKYLEDKKSTIWQSLTELIRQIIDFDRVMVYRFLEDNSGQVIAESKSEVMHSLMGYRYPEFDIPKQARELYTQFLARHTADTEGTTHRIIGSKAQEIDLGKCSLRALSPVHLQYLRNSNARASASFSVIMDGKLWGLVTCQNSTPKHVDLAQRHLCTFLTQYATNSYVSQSLKEDMESQQVMSTLEQELKGDLLIDRDVYHVLEKFAPQIMELAGADGLLIKQGASKKSWGIVPAIKQLREIDTFILQNHSEGIFATDSFQYIDNTGTNAEESVVLPGIVKIEILPHGEWQLYLFRKELVLEEVWAGKPEKLVDYDPERKIAFPSPRTSFDAWIQTTRGKSLQWRKRELTFVEHIVYITQQALIKKKGEIEELNKELIRSNNALDTFSYTLSHDLKNPLSAIRLAAQMILAKNNLPDGLLNKLGANILDATTLITEMIDKVHELSKSNSVALELALIDPRDKILAIIESCKQQYELAELEVVLGPTLPIRGEGTLLYQLFLNLLGNAIKYSSKQPYPRIELYSTQSGSQVSYFVKDNGIGMDLHAGANIFEIFHRLPNSSPYDGSGIGLSIVKRITDKLGADIKVDSQLDKGTLFQIDFYNDL